MKKTISLLVVATIVFPAVVLAQNVGIGTSSPHPSAQLQVSSANKGLLVPRVYLSNTFLASPVGSPDTSLLVFNNNSSMVGGLGDGFYYWTGSRWNKLSTSSESWQLTGNSGIDTAIQFLGTRDNTALRFRVNNEFSGAMETFTGNTFFGFRAGSSNQFSNQSFTGEKNTFFGMEAGRNNTTGRFNTFIGQGAGRNETVAFGNTVVGANSGAGLSTGNNNSILGIGAGGVSTGSDNVVVGASAGVSMGAASGNTYIGTDVAGFNNGGDFNVYLGHRAGYGNFGLFPKFESFNNVYIGDSSGHFTNGGRNNAFVGKRSGFNNQQGSYNTFIGDSTGWNNVTGNQNTYLGSQARGNNAALQNATAVGAHAFVTAANSMVLGGVTGQNGATDMTNVGIGINNPARRLWVRFDENSTGLSPIVNSIQVWERSGASTFASFLTDADREAGILFGNSSSTADGGIVYNSASNLRGMQIRTGGNAVRMTVNATGNVGIGTDDPAYRLHVVTNDAQNFGYREGIVVENTATGVGNTGEAAISFKNQGPDGTGTNQWMVGLNQNRNLAFAYGGDFAGGSITKVLIDSTGNMGIGTTAPAQKLDVNGNQRLSGSLVRPATGSNDMIPICYGSVSGSGAIFNGTGNFTSAKTATGQYEITITGETYSNFSFVTIITPLSTSLRMACAATTGGKLQVRVFDAAAAQQDTSFYFIVYKL